MASDVGKVNLLRLLIFRIPSCCNLGFPRIDSCFVLFSHVAPNVTQCFHAVIKPSWCCSCHIGLTCYRTDFLEDPVLVICPNNIGTFDADFCVAGGVAEPPVIADPNEHIL